MFRYQDQLRIPDDVQKARNWSELGTQSKQEVCASKHTKETKCCCAFSHIVTHRANGIARPMLRNQFKERKKYFIGSHGKFGSPYAGKAQQLLPILMSVHYFPVSKQWYGCQCLGIFNVHTDVDACESTRGLYRHRKRVCTATVS